MEDAFFYALVATQKALRYVPSHFPHSRFPHSRFPVSHFNSDGNAHMVDVSAKSVTTRVAVASGEVKMAGPTATVIRSGDAQKGDVLAVARLAAISAAKWTSHLIPLCHAIAIEAVAIEFDWAESGPSGF